MIRLELQPEIEAQLAAEAQARGLTLDRYIEEIVETRVGPQAQGHAEKLSISDAIDRIIQQRESTALGGLKIKDLIEEGRKY